MTRVCSLTFTFELRARQFEEVELLDAFFLPVGKFSRMSYKYV